MTTDVLEITNEEYEVRAKALPEDKKLKLLVAALKYTDCAAEKVKLYREGKFRPHIDREMRLALYDMETLLDREMKLAMYDMELVFR